MASTMSMLVHLLAPPSYLLILCDTDTGEEPVPLRKALMITELPEFRIVTSEVDNLLC